MRNLLAVAIVLASVALGLYVGAWFCFIGGIVQVVEAAKMAPVSAMGIAIGLLRVVAAGVCGMVTFWVVAFLGWGLYKR